MALLTVRFRSEVLGHNVSLEVLLPERVCPRPDGKWPTLYLLHGLHGDDSAWQRQTSVERYVKDADLAVIMPSVHNGFYTDMRHGEPYWTFVSEELPAVCERMFPLSARREDRFAAGLSMGGYGALKLGLRLPERYAAVASLSGVVDIAGYARKHNQYRKEPHFVNVFGSMEALEDSDDDLPAVARRLIAAGGVMPKVYMACGTEDYLHENNLDFLREFEQPLAIQYEEGPGVHDWYFWDAYVQRVIAWLPIGDA